MAVYCQIEDLKQKKEFSDFIEQLLFSKLHKVQMLTGSCIELPAIYFFERVTDIDSIVHHRNICALNKDATAPKDFKGTVLIIQSEESHHGHARLVYKSDNTPFIFATPPEERPARWQFVLEKSDISPSLISDTSYMSRCLDNFQTLSRDLVDAIWCPNWPEEANEWKHRERLNGWPLEETVNRIVNNGCLLVAKPHQGSQFIANEWRFSFSEAELFLIHSWSYVQIHIYHILRLIKSDVVRKCGGKNMTVLTTYHFKTLMFWACEELPKEFWLADNIEASVKELLIIMIEWLTEKQCRNYFMPGNNMLDHLSDSHDFESEAQFLTDSLNFVDQFISSTVPFKTDREHDQYKQFYVRIPTNLIYALQLRACLLYIVDPSALGSGMYIHCNGIGKSQLFRSDIFNLFQCLAIHRRLISAKSWKEKLSRLHEIEECFQRTYEKEVDGFTHVDITPMDNIQVIATKLLRKNIDSSNSFESLKNNRQKSQSMFLHTNSTRWELCYSRTESMQRSHVAYIIEIVANVMNESIVKPTCFHTAAYEANLYWTMCIENRIGNPRNNFKKALDICNKWHSYVSKDSLTFRVGFGMQGLPIIISNRWAIIFDKYIQVVTGFLSLVKAITTGKFESNYKLSDTNTDFDVLVHVHARDFLEYIRYQCNFHWKDYLMLDDFFTRDMQIDISRTFLYTAARISTDARQTSSIHDL